MLAMLIPLALKVGVPKRFAKAAVIVTLVLLAAGAFFAAKAIYDSSVIEKHELERDAATAKADRAADAKSAEERRADDSRLAQESQEVKEAINEARSEGRDPRAAYYACVKLQQSARARGEPPADC